MVIEEPKKKSNALLVILMFLIGIGLGFGANYGMSYFNKSAKETKSSTVNEKEDKKVEVTDEVKEKLNLFINAASYGYGDHGEFMKSFVDGKDSFDDSEKYLIVYNVLYYKKLMTQDVVLAEQEIDSLKDEKLIEYFKNYKDAFLDISKIEIFDGVYNYLFNTNKTKTYENPYTHICPVQIGVNEEYGNIYFGQECGGTGGFSFEQSIKSYEFDGNNYLVHQECTLTATPGGETDVKLLWKFDKDLNFVSTEKE